MKEWFKSKYTVLFGILGTAAVFKLLISISGAFSFNSDEAIVALMARHILQGERPIFFYGQAYMGSLDAFLVAGGFLLFGEQIWVIRLIQGLLYLGMLFSLVKLGEALFGSQKNGLLAAGLLAIPTVNLMLYSTVSLGGYGEALLLGNLTLLSACNLKNNLSRQDLPIHSLVFQSLVFGFLMGLGLWTLGLTIVYAAPAMAWIGFIWLKAKPSRKKWLGFTGGISFGFVLGSTPWWFYAVRFGLSRLISELLGGNVAVEAGTWLSKILVHGINLTIFGLPVILGFRPPWEVRWLAIPLAPFVLAIWLMVIVFTIKRIWKEPAVRQSYFLLLGVGTTLVLAFILTPFGIDPSGRYYLPLAIPLSLMAAEMISSAVLPSKVWRIAFVGVLVGSNLIGTIQCAIKTPPGLSTQFNPETVVDHRYDRELIQFLLSNGITRGYSNYWVSYPLAFLSAEQIIFSPRLPYHLDFRYTSLDDRYPLYDELVAESPTIAYITTSHPLLDQRIQMSLTEQNTEWDEKQIGNYHIFYHISKRVSLVTMQAAIAENP